MEPPILAELQARARAEGLWNLFLPDEELGVGLSTLDYAPIAEAFGFQAATIRTLDDLKKVAPLLAKPDGPVFLDCKLNAAVVEALADADVRARLATLGQEIFPREQQTPEALAAYHKAEIEKWWPIIKAANIKGE